MTYAQQQGSALNNILGIKLKVLKFAARLSIQIISSVIKLLWFAALKQLKTRKSHKIFPQKSKIYTFWLRNENKRRWELGGNK